MPRVLVLAKRGGCCQVVVNWYWMLCHTQYIHNLAWNEQWSGTASAVCLCPLPTSSVQPLGWDWEPPCTESLVHWCALWRDVRIPPQLKEFCWFLNWQECVTDPDCGGVSGLCIGVLRHETTSKSTFMKNPHQPHDLFAIFIYNIYSNSALNKFINQTLSGRSE